MELKGERERVLCALCLYGELGANVVGTLLQGLQAYAAAVRLLRAVGGRVCGVHDAHTQVVVFDGERDVYVAAAVLDGVARCLLYDAVGFVSHRWGNSCQAKELSICSFTSFLALLPTVAT